MGLSILACRRPGRVWLAAWCLGVALAWGWSAPVEAAQDPRPVKIGVLAYGGDEKCLREWSPTAQYLSAALSGHEFAIVPLTFEQVDAAVGSQRVDFILANPVVFVDVEAVHGVSRVATMKYLGPTGYYANFGGVVFTRADRADIRELKDLKGKSFMAVTEVSFGGWLLAYRDLKAVGINPFQHFQSLSFVDHHEMIPLAVRDGKVDAGTCRTGTLEKLAAEGMINLSDFFVINQQERGSYPFLRSTPVYPEWTMGKARHTPDELGERVAVALLEMPPDASAAKAAHHAGWTVPQNFQSVREVMIDLKIGPYKEVGKITLAAVINKYWLEFILASMVFCGMVVFIVTVLGLHGRIKQANLALEDEIKERQRAEERFRTMSDFAYHWEMWLGMDGNLIYISPSCKKITGYWPDDFYADPGLVHRIIHPDDSPQVIDHLLDNWAGPDREQLEFRITTKDGEERWIGHYCRPVVGSDGAMMGRRVTNQDITRMKIAELERRALAEQLQEAQAKIDSLSQGRG